MPAFTQDTNGTITYHVTDGDTADKTYETAAWYMTLALDPGDYEIRPVTIGWQPTAVERAYWVLVTVPGTVTASHFPTLYGGVAVGTRGHNEEVGKRDTKTYQFHAYTVRHQFDIPAVYA